MKRVVLFLGLLLISFNLSAQEMTEKETKAIHKEHKKAERDMKRAEKKHKKAEKEHKNKEKSRKDLEKAKNKYQKANIKYETLKNKGTLEPKTEERWLQKLDRLNEDIIKAEKKFKRA
ncbi:hypothetical protein [Hanstruepera marina]|uniref:hypothetical protein n=1 Tax=Hanstruepera marina TaxID=2873265 RepID=UPI001CA6368D|nr:hypothetical protein [Hanstruepera marina]